MLDAIVTQDVDVTTHIEGHKSIEANVELELNLPADTIDEPDFDFFTVEVL